MTKLFLFSVLISLSATAMFPQNTDSCQPPPDIKFHHPDRVQKAVMNFSDVPQTVTFKESLYQRKYTEYFSGKPSDADANSKLILPPCRYRVSVK